MSWYDRGSQRSWPTVSGPSVAGGTWSGLNLSADHLIVVVELLDPLILLLTLAGYEVTQIALQVSPDELPLLLNLVHLDRMLTATIAPDVWTTAVSYTFPGEGGAIALYATPRTRFKTVTRTARVFPLRDLLVEGRDGDRILQIGLGESGDLNLLLGNIADAVEVVRARVCTVMGREERDGARGLLGIYDTARWRFGTTVSADSQRVLRRTGDRLETCLNALSAFLRAESRPATGWVSVSTLAWSEANFVLPTWFNGVGALTREQIVQLLKGSDARDDKTWDSLLSDEGVVWDADLAGWHTTHRANLIAWFRAHVRYMPKGWNIEQYVGEYLASWDPTEVPHVAELRWDDFIAAIDPDGHEDLNTYWDAFFADRTIRYPDPPDDPEISGALEKSVWRDRMLLWLHHHLQYRAQFPEYFVTIGDYVTWRLAQKWSDLNGPAPSMGRWTERSNIADLLQRVTRMGDSNWLYNAVALVAPDLGARPLTPTELKEVLSPWHTDLGFDEADYGWKTYTRFLLAAHERGHLDLLSASDLLTDAIGDELTAWVMSAIDLIWPSGTGVEIIGNLQVGVFIGLLLGAEFAASGTGRLAIKRAGTTLEIEIECSGGAGLSVEWKEAAEIVFGGSRNGTGTITITLDMTTIPWNHELASAVEAVAQRDIAGVLGAIVKLGTATLTATGLVADLSAFKDSTAEGGIGEGPVAEATIAGANRTLVGTRFSRSAPEFGAEVRASRGVLGSAAAEITPQMRDKIAGLLDVWNERVVAPFTGFDGEGAIIDGEASVWRTGNFLPGPSDSANSINFELIGTLLARGTQTRASADWTYEFAVGVHALGAVSFLGQTGKLTNEMELSFRPDTWLECCQNAYRNELKFEEALACGPEIAQSTVIEVTIQDPGLMRTVFGDDLVGRIPLVRDSVDNIRVRLSIAWLFDLEAIWTLCNGYQALWDRLALTRALLMSGNYFLATLQLVNTVRIEALTNPNLLKLLFPFVTSMELEFRFAAEAFYDGQTPAYAAIPGLQSQGSGQAATLYTATVSPEDDVIDFNAILMGPLKALLGELF